MKLKISEQQEIMVGHKLSGYVDGDYITTAAVIAIEDGANKIRTKNGEYEIERITKSEMLAMAVADQ